MTDRQKEVLAKLGVLALGVAVAVGVVAFRHQRDRELAEAEAQKQLVGPRGQTADDLDPRFAEIDKLLDAQEAFIRRVEDGTLTPEERLDAADAVTDHLPRIHERLKRVVKEVEDGVRSGGINAGRFDHARARMGRQNERSLQLAERFDAALKTVTFGDPKKP